jgi:RNA polymerase sigma factor (sigma-70 family)
MKYRRAVGRDFLGELAADCFIAALLIFDYLCSQQRMASSNKKHSSSRHASPSPSLADPKRIESREEDSRLIKEALGGSQPAFERLKKKYHDSVFNLIYRMVREKDEVEDLVQEAFIKAFMSLASFNDEYAFSTWLYKIATNNCIDYLRRKKLSTFSINKPIEAKDSEYTFEVPDSTYEPDRDMIERQKQRLFEEAINSLPPKYRRVIILRHSEEKDYQEIAKLLNLPLGTVKAHIFRAREMLYKYLRDKMRNY